MNWLQYQNQGATRNKPLSPRLVDALSFLPELGVEMRVISGGQDAKGQGNRRTGSTRHDHGGAADADFYMNGRKLDWNNPDDVPVFSDIVKRARANGVTGIGAGDDYMGAGRMHIGFGNEAVWGAGGKGENAPAWLRTAFHGEPGHVHVPGDERQGSNDTLLGGLSLTPDRMGAPSILDTMEAPEMEPQKATGILGSLFGDMTEDRADQIRLGVNGMLHNPNRGLERQVQGRMDDRRDTRKANTAAQQAAQQANKTAAWLATQPGGEQFAQAVSTGALPAGQALQMWQAQSKGRAAIKGTEINGQLVNPVTGDIIGDYRDQGGQGSAKEQQIARIKEAYGVDDQTAVGIADNVLNVSRDPVDQSVIVTNLATGESYSPQVNAGGQPAVQPSVPPIPQPSAPDATPSFGIEGVAKNAINGVSDAAGFGTPFEDVQRSVSDFSVMREGLLADIAAAYPRQPPSWLLKEIRTLTPETATLRGADTNRSKLEALKRSMTTEMNSAIQQSQRKMSPAAKQELEQKIAGFGSAIAKIDDGLSRFGGSSTGNKTKSGVSWSVEE